ncbi:MAG: PQQ-binding-like beta-propeller repeat protein [Bacteroidota bacterium]
MKKPFICLSLAAMAFAAMPAEAQFAKLKDKMTTGGSAKSKSDGFTTVWESEFENKANVLSVVNNEGEMILGTSDNQATMLDATGKTMWNGKYKALSTNGVSDADFQFSVWGANALFVFDKKMGKDKVTVLNMKTGKEMWNTDAYADLSDDNVEYISEMDAFLFSLKNSLVMVKAKTGEKVWETSKFKGAIGSYLFLKDKNELIMVNFKPTALGALFTGFKNQFVRINAANGEVKWDATFAGMVEKEIITRKPLVKLSKVDDKVFLQLNGLQVFDYNSGQKLWAAVYETDEAGRKGFGSGTMASAIYGAIADPLVDNNSVYLVLGGDKAKIKFIEKHDLLTGKLLWISEKIKDATAMPHIYLSNGRVVAQVGGYVNLQKKTKDKQPDGSIVIHYTSEWVFQGKFGILALDDNDGKASWRSEKFDKRITDLVFDGASVFAAGGDEFYSYDIKSGKQNYSINHSDAKVGKSMWAFDLGEDVAIVCDRGIAAYNKATGKRKYASDKVKDVDAYHMVGKNFFLRDQRNNKNKLIAVDLATGDTKGEVVSKGVGGGGSYGDGFDISSDGEYIFAFKGKSVEKLKVNP